MSATHKVALALAALTFSLAGAPAAMAQGYRPPQIDVDPRIPNVVVNVQVGSAPQPDYPPPIVREQINESYSERHTTREYGR